MKYFRTILNSKLGKELVNQESFTKLEFRTKERPLPIGEVNEIVNAADRFNYERQQSTRYRLNGTINPLFTNVLFNVTGANSFADIMQREIFRDRSYPPNGIDLDEEEDLSYKEALEYHITEVDGWFGYYDPDIAAASNCVFYDMTPTRDMFTLTPKNLIKNWELTITYPESSSGGYLVDNGLLIVDKKSVLINGRNMTAFGIPVKHGLTRGSIVRISGLNQTDFNGEYPVIRVGLDNGDHKEYYFCIDVPDTSISLGLDPRMIRMVGTEPSIYYYRIFKKAPTNSTLIMETDDYEIYPLAFSKNIYNDSIAQFVINEDIDVNGLTDNLGRPISELYITLIKSDSSGVFSQIKSGIDMPLIDSIEFNAAINDVNRITNIGISHTPVETGITISQNSFFGDIVEFNRFEVKERILGDIHHRFNTNNRDAGGYVYDSYSGTTIDLGVRPEGYTYKPHQLIKIREFSSYIEQGDNTVEGIPDYAVDLGDGRYLWRDLMDIGYNDIKNNVLDYPFLNGAHYIHSNIIFPLKRQDPFNKYGIFYTLFPKDGLGDAIPNNITVKRADDAN